MRLKETSNRVNSNFVSVSGWAVFRHSVGAGTPEYLHLGVGCDGQWNFGGFQTSVTRKVYEALGGVGSRFTKLATSIQMQF